MHRRIVTAAIVFMATLGITWNGQALAGPQAAVREKPYVLVAAPPVRDAIRLRAAEMLRGLMGA